jgi:MFS family permease
VPFYVVHATRELSLPVTFVGLAVAAQNISTIVSSLGWGTLAERATSRRVIQASTLAASLAPLGALVLHSLYTGNNLPSQLLGASYLLVFAVLSAVDNSILLGYLNYVMEIAPPGQRTAYMGLTNTISGLLVTLPVAGGALLQVTSYPVLFAVAAMGAGIGFAVSLRLPRLGKE